MPLRLVHLVGALLVTLLIVPTPVTAGDHDWHVTGVQSLEQNGAETRLLSPDGTMIFEARTDRPDEICVRVIEPDETRCGSLPPEITEIESEEQPIRSMVVNVASATWAPDSSAVAFSLNWSQTLIDSDIYLLDVDTGDIRNLTDDGIEDYRGMTADDEILTDTYPAWTPEGDALLFHRLDLGSRSASIMRLPLDASEPEVVAAFPDDVAPLLKSPIHALPDGSILFSTTPNPNDPSFQSGVVRMAPDGTMEVLIANEEESGFGEPGFDGIDLIGVSPDGIRFLVFRPVVLVDDLDKPNIALVDMTTGEETPIEGRMYAPPIFSPDGSVVLMALQNVDIIDLALVYPDGSTTVIETVAIQDSPEDPAGSPILPRMTWSDDDQVLLHTSVGTFLLQLSPGMPDAASPAASPAPTPSATPADVATTDAPYRALRPDYAAPGGELALLSPDGSRIATIGHDGSTELRITEIETLEQTRADIGIDSKSLQGMEWSPDNTALVFTSEPLITGLDSDIWLMDALTGDVSNLTDDGSDVLADAPMDVWPGWTPDGEIVFQRYDRDENGEVAVSLMRLSPNGGEPEEVVRFPREYATVMSGPAFVLEDGSIILGTMPATGFTTGIFRVSPDGEFEHLADDNAIPGQESLVVLDVTGDGSTALVYGRPSHEIRFFGGTIALMDLGTGEITRPEALAGEPIAPATFSPDDRYVLSAAPGQEEGLSLVITEIETAAYWEVPFTDHSTEDEEAMWPHLSLDWAENDTVLLHTGTPTSVVIQLVTP